MIIKNQIEFLKKCYENIEKFSFYLSISNPNDSCEVALVLKRYYQWVLKNTLKIEVESENLIKFFNDIVKDLSYIPVSKLDYDDIKKLIVCHFSLGELYIHNNNRSFAKEHFENVVDTLLTATKGDNKLFNMVQDNSDITIFELSMWARKNLGDICNTAEDSLEFYEDIVSDREFLFLEKNKCIYYAAKSIDDIDKAYEAALNVIKVAPYYENVDKDVVVFLKDMESYLKALDICKNRYIDLKDSYFIDVASKCCEKAKKFTTEYLDKVIEILDETIYSLDFDMWEKLSNVVYKEIKNDDIVFEHFIRYFNDILKKISYSTCEYTYFNVSTGLLRKIYKDVEDKKYNNSSIRDLEEELTFYFMIASINNRLYGDSIECATKLLSLNNFKKLNFDIEIVKQVLEESIQKIKNDVTLLKEYPWMELICKIEAIGEKVDVKTNIEYDDQCRIMRGSIKLVEISSKHNSKDILDCLINNNKFKAKIEKEEYIILDNDNIDMADVVIVNNNSTSDNVKKDILNIIKQYKNNIKILFILNKEKGFEVKDVNEIKEFINEEGFDINLCLYDGKDINDIFESIEEMQPQNITMYRYNDFYNKVLKQLNNIKDKCEKEFLEEGLEVQQMEECSFKYKEFDKEVKENLEGFKDKIDQDIDFLQEYINSKINTVVPAIIEENVNVVEEFKENKNIREESQNKISELILKWYEDNITKLMQTQFSVFLSKYEKIYYNELELIRNINNNTNKILPIAKEFEKDFNEIKFPGKEEFINNISLCYEDYIATLSKDIKLFPRKSVLKNLTAGIATIFSKQTDKSNGKCEMIRKEILEDIDIVCDNLYYSIFDKVEELNLKIITEVENMYKELLDVLNEYNLISNKILEMKKIKRGEIDSRNEEIFKNLEFVNIQIEKFKCQIIKGFVYNNGAIFKVPEN